MAPVYEDAAKRVKELYPFPGHVVFAKVDCEDQIPLAATHKVNKFPTIKMFVNGDMARHEYRGDRSVAELVKFVQFQLRDPIQRVAEKSEIAPKIDEKKRNIVGYFDSEESEDFKTYQKISKSFRDDCEFFAGIGDEYKDVRLNHAKRTYSNIITFRPTSSEESTVRYSGSIRDFNYLYQWVKQKCVVLVREITFKNAEDLTEEGLPMVILFHHPEDTAIVERYRKFVAQQLMDETQGVNFLVADGLQFNFPLKHLGKTAADLPVLAIDSFKHMYLFPGDVKTDLERPGLVKKFIAALHSGRLHREFHDGPDADNQPGIIASIFQKLLPTGEHHTVLKGKDEL